MRAAATHACLSQTVSHPGSSTRTRGPAAPGLQQQRQSASRLMGRAVPGAQCYEYRVHSVRAAVHVGASRAQHALTEAVKLQDAWVAQRTHHASLLQSKQLHFRRWAMLAGWQSAGSRHLPDAVHLGPEHWACTLGLLEMTSRGRGQLLMGRFRSRAAAGAGPAAGLPAPHLLQVCQDGVVC